MKEKIVIFNALDTIQGYKGAKQGKSKPFYQKHIAKQAGYKNVEKFIYEVPYETQLWMTFFELQKGNLEPIPIAYSDLVMASYKQEGIEPIIVTADIPKSAALTCKYFVDEGIIKPENIIAMSHLGSKFKSQSWAKTQQEFFSDKKVIGIYEEEPEEVMAAGKAYKLGIEGMFQVKNGLTKGITKLDFFHTGSMTDYCLMRMNQK